MRLAFSIFAYALGIFIASVSHASPISEPIAERIPQKIQHHGITVTDEYAWLKTANWRQVLDSHSELPAAIKNYLQAENDYFNAKMAPTLPLQRKLYQELIGRVPENDSSVPKLAKGYAYFWRDEQGKNYRMLYRRPVKAFQQASAIYSLLPSQHDQLILDVNLLAKGKSSFRLGASKHTNDQRLLAYSLDNDGSEHYQIFVRDMITGKDLPDHLIDTDGNIAWLLDGSGFYYIRLDQSKRARSVWLHKLGTPQKDDALIYQVDQDSSFTVSIWVTRNQKYFGIGVGDYRQGEVYIIDAEKPQSQPRLIAKNEPDLQYAISQHSDKLYIRTNADGADDFKIMVAPLKTPQRKYWRELISHKPGRFIISMAIFARHLVRKERENGIERLVIRRLSDGKEHTLTFPQQAYSLNYSSGYLFDTNSLRITYSSLTMPLHVYDYDMEKRTSILRKQQQIPSGHQPENYITRRLSTTAHDGEQIPITLLYHKNTPLNGTAPLLLKAYGAYGQSQHAYFRRNILSLVNRGFVLALAHVRGGMDKGYQWYAGGRLRNKTNTFKDYMSVANYLVAVKFTGTNRVIGYGASAGGMILGYAANQQSNLFCAMVLDVPFVDVLNTMLDDSLPLTPGEWSEWGNPAQNSADFKNILSYSPYENISAKTYPHIMVLASLSDSRVTYWEPAKWVARIRALRTNDNVLMLRTDMSSGHAGVSGRYRGLRGVAMIYAFMIKAAGGSRCAVTSSN